MIKMNRSLRNRLIIASIGYGYLILIDLFMLHSWLLIFCMFLGLGIGGAIAYSTNGFKEWKNHRKMMKYESRK